MSILEQADKLIAQLTPGEKARLLQLVVGELGKRSPGIDTDPNVAGGEACIVRTRIPVWLLIHARQVRTNEAELLRFYPTCAPRTLRMHGCTPVPMPMRSKGTLPRTKPLDASRTYFDNPGNPSYFLPRRKLQKVTR